MLNRARGRARGSLSASGQSDRAREHLSLAKHATAERKRKEFGPGKES
jgi:hypothetical protein